ncbi:MAG: alpha-D-ribose 1-methylphosphonate 5-phosphate C-P-lyase PhnJ [Acidimicrobiia bacterium]|nr:alpha-D-ribose 1-methylphosphonate 5-phosphate C-P-lyase PhnJ [Acidimicrobiia bacterium]
MSDQPSDPLHGPTTAHASVGGAGVGLLDRLLEQHRGSDEGSFGFLDEGSTREIRRATLTAVAVPGYQVPFGSREMPVARGWGSGGLQVTLAIVGPDDVVKVIDQGDDDGVNATNLRRLVAATTGVSTTDDARAATVVQTRHRIPEDPLRSGQTLVLQVPVPEPLRGVERDMSEQRRLHAEADYARMWVSLYEDKVRNGVISRTTGYPCAVAGRYVIATTPIPRWDVPALHQADHLSLFGAGREKRIYAVPPHTDVVPLTFDDVPFEVERAPDSRCGHCGSTSSFLVEVPSSDGEHTVWVCSDTDWCRRHREGAVDTAAALCRADPAQHPAGRLARAAGDVSDRPGDDGSIARPRQPPIDVLVHPGSTLAPPTTSPSNAPDGLASRIPCTGLPAEGSLPADPDSPPWTLWVEELGRIYGRGSPADVEGTGPEFGTVVSPTSGAVVGAWNVSLQVSPGEALGIIGESGSGKSTVLRCLAGEQKATVGRAHLASVDDGHTDILSLDDARIRALRVSHLSVVHQDPAEGLDLSVSAGGNIADRLTAAGMRSFAEIRHRAAELLERVEVPLERMDDPVREFSGGMRQRVQLAKALANEPPLLLLDEPTTGLDASVAAGVLDLLRTLLDELGVAAVVVSHDIGVIELLTRRVLVMHQGRVVEQGLTDQLLADPQHPYSQRLVSAARG